jgi:hypothetical protein
MLIAYLCFQKGSCFPDCFTFVCKVGPFIALLVNFIIVHLSYCICCWYWTIGNESLHETSNDNGVRVVNFITSKNLVVKSTMFPNRKIHKNTWTSPDGKTHNQIDHVLVERRQSSILDVRSFTRADCDTGHDFVAAKLKERLSVIKRVAQKFDIQRFDLRK